MDNAINRILNIQRRLGDSESNERHLQQLLDVHVRQVAELEDGEDRHMHELLDLHNAVADRDFTIRWMAPRLGVVPVPGPPNGLGLLYVNGELQVRRGAPPQQQPPDRAAAAAP